jgi:hypothetical protein
MHNTTFRTKARRTTFALCASCGAASAMLSAAGIATGAAAASRLHPHAEVTACLGQRNFNADISLVLPSGTTPKQAKKIEARYRPRPGTRLAIKKKKYRLHRRGRAYIGINPRTTHHPQATATDIRWSFRSIKTTNKYLRAINKKKATLRYSSSASGKRTLTTRVYGFDACGSG